MECRIKISMLLSPWPVSTASHPVAVHQLGIDGEMSPRLTRETDLLVKCQLNHLQVPGLWQQLLVNSALSDPLSPLQCHQMRGEHLPACKHMEPYPSKWLPIRDFLTNICRVELKQHPPHTPQCYLRKMLQLNPTGLHRTTGYFPSDQEMIPQ